MENNHLPIDQLIQRRDELLQQITQIKDMRQGTLIPRYRKCGKPTCHCAKDGSPGHGPSWSLTKDVNGKTVTKIIPKGPAVEWTQEQIGEFKRYRMLSRELVEVNEKICDAKLETWKAGADATAQKGASKPNLPQQSTRS